MRAGFTILGAVAFAAACAGPHSGEAEPLERPSPQQSDDDEATEPDRCRTDFYAEPVTGERDRDGAREQAARTEGVLLRAERERGEERERFVVEAIDQLVAALEKDPYGPEPTYRLAVAYALADRRHCAIRLLERIAELTEMPEVASEAGRMIQRAKRDIVFDDFRDEADEALAQ